MNNTQTMIIDMFKNRTGAIYGAFIAGSISWNDCISQVRTMENFTNSMSVCDEKMNVQCPILKLLEYKL